jgi:hypothetical protein
VFVAAAGCDVAVRVGVRVSSSSSSSLLGTDVFVGVTSGVGDGSGVDVGVSVAGDGSPTNGAADAGALACHAIRANANNAVSTVASGTQVVVRWIMGLLPELFGFLPVPWIIIPVRIQRVIAS